MPRIIANIDKRFAASQTLAKKSSSKTTPTDTLAAVEKLLGKNFEKVGVGQGMALPVPEGETGKSFIAKVRGRLSAIGRKDQPWEGRVYNSMIDKTITEGRGEVLVRRSADTNNPLGVKVGGRPAGSRNKTEEEKAQAAATKRAESPPPSEAKKDTPKDDKPKGAANDTKVKDLTGGKTNAKPEDDKKAA